jgi:peptidoglycan/LPS O-acetylase OafA/YrhL
MWLANTAAAGSALSDEYVYGPGYYFASFLFVIAVAGLAKLEVTPQLAWIDRALGEIAYPVFLVQWLAGFLTALAISPGQWRGWTLTLSSLPLTFAMAIALAVLNRRLIEPLRQRHRAAAVAPKALPLEESAQAA